MVVLLVMVIVIAVGVPVGAALVVVEMLLPSFTLWYHPQTTAKAYCLYPGNWCATATAAAAAGRLFRHAHL